MDTQRCIWMDAKAVEYQLCPLKHNCDACDFHKEMLQGCRAHTGATSSALMNLRDPEPDLIQFHPGLQYINGHYWYKRIGAGKIRIGLNAFVWQLFSSTHHVLMPALETLLVKEQCFSWLVLESGIVYLKSPFPGRVTAINPIFAPESNLNPPYFLLPESELWFLELQVDDDSFRSIQILAQDAYLEVVTHDQERLRTLTDSTADKVEYSLSRISQLSKHDFGRYLRQISEGRILIC